jgi:RimJ/RimL family protein N-acetyltransferase
VTLLVVYNPAEGPRWAERQFGYTRFTQQAHTLSVLRRGEIVASVVFDRFAGPDCEISIATDKSRRWLNREVAIRIAAYPFAQLGLDRVSAFVDAGNQGAIQLVNRLGFRLEGEKRHPDPAKSVLMFGLLKDECRWLASLRYFRAKAA